MMRSDVYERLVKDEKDITGLTAYGIYKKCRNDFIRKKQNETGSQILPDEIIDSFNAAQTNSMLDLYRNHAKIIVEDFTKIEREKLRPELDSEYCRKYEALKPPSFWYGVIQSFTASFLFLLAGYILLRMTGSWDMIMNLFVK